MYEYENGEKKRNVGYARVETRNGECKFTLHMQLQGLLEGIFPTYLINRPKEKMNLVYIGDCVVKNQVMDSRIRVKENNIMDSGHKFSDMGGVLFFLKSDVFYATQWDDKPVMLEEVLHALKPKSKQPAEKKVELALESDQKKLPLYMLPGGLRAKEGSLAIHTDEPINPRDLVNRYKEYIAASSNLIEGDEDKSKEEKILAFKLADGNEAEESQEKIEKQKEEVNQRKIEIQREEENQRKIEIQREEVNQRKIEKQKEEVNQRKIEKQKEEENQREEENQKNNKIQNDSQAVAKIFANHTRIYPFEDNTITRSVKFEPKDIGVLPAETWILNNNSFLLHGYYCYHHLIFAEIKNQHGSSYILGVPGIYHARERFMARMFGFESFIPIHKGELKQGDFGYWYLGVNI
jgi:hypothetical protein